MDVARTNGGSGLTAAMTNCECAAGAVGVAHFKGVAPFYVQLAAALGETGRGATRCSRNPSSSSINDGVSVQ